MIDLTPYRGEFDALSQAIASDDPAERRAAFEGVLLDRLVDINLNAKVQLHLLGLRQHLIELGLRGEAHALDTALAMLPKPR